MKLVSLRTRFFKIDNVIFVKSKVDNVVANLNEVG